jgi:hypothetical protein
MEYFDEQHQSNEEIEFNYIIYTEWYVRVCVHLFPSTLAPGAMITVIVDGGAECGSPCNFVPDLRSRLDLGAFAFSMRLFSCSRALHSSRRYLNCRSDGVSPSESYSAQSRLSIGGEYACVCAIAFPNDDNDDDAGKYPAVQTSLKKSGSCGCVIIFSTEL